jgi:hypothetical protein
MPLLYAGSNLDKAREIFVTIVKHRPRPADHPATVQGMQQWPPRCFAAMKKPRPWEGNRGKLCHEYECFNKIRTHDFTEGSALFRWYDPRLMR